MTYKDIVNRIQDIVNDHYMLAAFGYGDLSDLKSRFENVSTDEQVQADYPYLFLNPATHTRSQAAVTYNFNMIVMDMARGEVSDDPYDNMLTIQSQCQQYIDDVIAQLYLGYTDAPQVLFDGLSYNTFNERFQDDVAGMTVNLQIVVPQPINNCVTPFDKSILMVDVTNNIEYTLGPDPGEDAAFTYATIIYDPNNDWTSTNSYRTDEPGQYKFVMTQQISLNQPAVGEALPSQPTILQIIDGPVFTYLPATVASGWPTTFVDTTTVYDFEATWYVTVPDRRPGGFVWEFVYLQDNQPQPESTLQQLVGGNVKIYKMQ